MKYGRFFDDIVCAFSGACTYFTFSHPPFLPFCWKIWRNRVTNLIRIRMLIWLHIPALSFPLSSTATTTCGENWCKVKLGVGYDLPRVLHHHSNNGCEEWWKLWDFGISVILIQIVKNLEGQTLVVLANNLHNLWIENQKSEIRETFYSQPSTANFISREFYPSPACVHYSEEVFENKGTEFIAKLFMNKFDSVWFKTIRWHLSKGNGIALHS